MGAAFAQTGICGFDGTTKLEALRLYGLPGEAPALLCSTPVLPVGTRESRPRNLPSLTRGINSLLDVTIANCWVGDMADAALP